MNAPAGQWGARHQVLLVPILEWRGRPSPDFAWVIGLLLLLPIAVGIKKDDWQLAIGLETLIVYALALCSWPLLVSAVIRQCSPANIQLTPGLAQHARLSLALVGCVGATALSLAISLQIGSFAIWWAANVLVLCGLAWMMRTPLFSFFAFFLLLPMLAGVLKFAQPTAFDSSPVIASVDGIAVLAAAYTFQRLLRLGGDASYTLQRVHREISGSAEGVGPRPSGSRIWYNIVTAQPLYARLLQRALRAQRPPEHLIGYLFGPLGHWSSVAAHGSLLLLFLPLALWFLHAHHGRIPDWVALDAALSLSAALPFLSSVYTWPASRREQTLLHLAPHMPRGRTLNRAAANAVVRLFAVCAGLSFTLVLATLLAGVEPLRILTIIGTLLAMALLTLGMQLGDFPRMAPRSLNDATAMFRSLAVIALTFSPLFVVAYLFGRPALATLLVVWLPAMAAFVWWRWHRMLDGPASLPVGHLLHH